MARPVSFFGQTIADNTKKAKNGDPETTSYEVAITTLTAGNAVAVTGLIGALNAAVDALIIGVIRTDNTVFDRHTGSLDRASSTAAQRENKWLVRYHDSIGGKFQVSIGTADLTLLPDGSEFLDIITGASAGNDFKVAFEAVVKSPDDSSLNVTVDSIQFVGRNT